MANITADIIHNTKPRGSFKHVRSFVVKNATTIYAGALVGTDANGFLDHWDDVAGHKFEGVLLEAVVGDTSATPPVEGRVDLSGDTLTSATVASAAQNSVNSLVYCPDDNVANLALSASTNVGPIGRVVRYVSSGVADVELFTPAEHEAKA